MAVDPQPAATPTTSLTEAQALTALGIFHKRFGDTYAVWLGFDRVVMLALGVPTISDAQAFGWGQG